MLSSIQVLDSRELLRQKILEISSRKPLSDEQIEFILDSYSEPWRHYHNCDHILKMFNIFEQCDKSSLTIWEQLAIRLMILWHDLFYKLSRDSGWNERMSANHSERDLLQAGYYELLIHFVFYGIHATAQHTLSDTPPRNQEVVAIFLDIDLLAGLGTSWKEFDGITKQIQREYEPLYTAAEFQVGRVKWAKSFLDRPQIFLSPEFVQYEPVARANLQRFIDEA